jgi:hypothetical protein
MLVRVQKKPSRGETYRRGMNRECLRGPHPWRIHQPIERLNTGTRCHIYLIVWKATERICKGCSLPLPRMLNGHKKGAIVRREGWPAHLTARQAAHEHLRHAPLWTLDFHNIDRIVLLDGGRLAIGGNPQTASIVEGNLSGHDIQLVALCP